jgi:hypothetical protein
VNRGREEGTIKKGNKISSTEMKTPYSSRATSKKEILRDLGKL